MKKGISILYALFYLTLSIGVHGTVHECMGRVTEISWGHEELSCHDEPSDHHSGGCDMPIHKSDCCDNNTVEIWLVEEQLAQKELRLPVVSVFALAGRCAPTVPREIQAERTEHFVPQAQVPPDIPLYIQYGDLRLYG